MSKFEIPKGMTIARIKRGGNPFEVLVSLDEALNFRRGKSDFLTVEGDRVFTDIGRGEVPTKDEMQVAFKTTDPTEIGKIIVKEGEVLIDQEHRDAEQEKKVKQVVEFLARNAVDPQTGNPITAEKIKNVLQEAHVRIKNVPIENQISEIVNAISSHLPIKLETKRIRVTVPAIQTGKVYGLLSQYKEKEDWLGNGDLVMTIKIPAGITLDFYDKLNSMTHGSALTEELGE